MSAPTVIIGSVREYAASDWGWTLDRWRDGEIVEEFSWDVGFASPEEAEAALDEAARHYGLIRSSDPDLRDLAEPGIAFEEEA